MRHHLLAPGRVLRKSAGREHHAAPRSERARRTAMGDVHSVDPAVGAANAGKRRFQEDWDIERQHAFREPAGDGLTQHQPGAARMGQPVAKMPGHHPRRIHGGGERARHLHEVADVEPVQQQPAEDGEIGDGRAQLREPAAEPAAVIVLGVQHAAAERGARRVGVVVRRVGPVVELQGGVLLEEVDHARAVVEKGAHHIRVESVAGLGLDVAEGFLPVVAHAAGAHLRIVGDPDRPAGDRRRAAEMGRLLDDRHVEAGKPRGDGGRHAGGARADDDQVVRILQDRIVARHAASPGRG